MPYSRDKVIFYGDQFWVQDPPSAFTFVTISFDKDAILADLDRLSTSALGRSLLDKALNADSLRFVGLTDQDAGGSPAYALNSTYGAKPEAVQINYAKSRDELFWFNSNGVLVQGSTALTIAHELAHIVYETRDPITASTTEQDMNAATFDHAGPQVRAQNVIARQLGMPDQVRVSYGGAVYGYADLANFTLGVSYTDGATVNIVRRGGNGANTMDHSARTDNSRDLMFGEGGDDEINGGGGTDWLYGGDGNDTIHGGTGRDTIWGDDQFDMNVAGNDIIYGEDGSDTIHGGHGDDDVYGGAGNDTIYGDDGNDLLLGEFGADHLIGGSGEDSLLGGLGNDQIEGGEDADVLRGEAGNDQLYGEDGDDVVFGGDGADSIFGGLGADLLRGDGGNDLIYGFDGEDEILGGDGIDRIFGGDAKDIIKGGAGNDIVFGEAGDDLIQGEAGADTLYGEGGEDSLLGGAGNDTLRSGSGDFNGLYGEAGTDTLIFDNGGGGVAEGGKGNDVIDARDSSSGVHVFWSAGDGLDRLAASYAFDVGSLTYTNLDAMLGSSPSARGGINIIEMQGQSINDFKLVWAPAAISTETIDDRNYYLYGGNLRLVDKATGQSGFDLGYVIGKSIIVPPTFSPTYLEFVDIPQLFFADGRFEDSPEGSDNILLEIGGAGSAPPAATMPNSFDADLMLLI